MKKREFLKDVLICSLGAYGGPEAHYGVFTDQLVIKKAYLTEEELIELIALCSILPGPTSTQTIVSVGHKIGGPRLALLTMLVWALPVLCLMTLLSFLYQFLSAFQGASGMLSLIGPMAVGFIIVAAYRINKKVLTDRLTLWLALLSAVTTYFIRSPWVFPLLLILGALATIARESKRPLWKRVALLPPWHYLYAFIFFGIGSILLEAYNDHILFRLFESFYRYGYLVFGGGQVVVPVMYTDLVQGYQYMTNAEFLTGYGLVQGLPGPMFSFSAYAGGMAARGYGVWVQSLGAIAGGVGIFLPGLLLIFFVYPIWSKLREIDAIKVALKGINAIAGGLILTSAIILMQKSGFSVLNLGVTLVSIIALVSRKVPAPLLVLGTLILGMLTLL